MVYKPPVKLDPTLDGITHINIGTRSSTRLGKMLSNMSMLGFSHPEYGSFASLEGFWYWLATGKQHDTLRKLYGTQAKFKGKEFEQIHLDNFQEVFLGAMRCRLEQHQELRQLLQKNKLPLTHYYWFGTDPTKAKVVDVGDKHGWQIEFYHHESICDNLLKDAKVCVEGEFECGDVELVCTVITTYLGGKIVTEPKSADVVVIGSRTDTHYEHELVTKIAPLSITIVREQGLDDLLGGGSEFGNLVEITKADRDNTIEDTPRQYPKILQGEDVVFKGVFKDDWAELRSMVEAMGANIHDEPVSGNEFTVVGQLTSQVEYDALESCGARIIPEGVLRHGNIDAILHWRNLR